MRANIYDQHSAAFKYVAAYVICDGADKVATVAFKYPRDGAGRLYAYVHWLGNEMTRGYASGCGYDKHSAAVSVAVKRADRDAEASERYRAFVDALRKDGGSYWFNHLSGAGFTVHQAV